MPRCDNDGKAFAGSQRQIQCYVNEHPSVLNQAITDAYGMPFTLRWVPIFCSGMVMERFTLPR